MGEGKGYGDPRCLEEVKGHRGGTSPTYSDLWGAPTGTRSQALCPPPLSLRQPSLFSPGGTEACSPVLASGLGIYGVVLKAESGLLVEGLMFLEKKPKPPLGCADMAPVCLSHYPCQQPRGPWGTQSRSLRADCFDSGCICACVS